MNRKSLLIGVVVLAVAGAAWAGRAIYRAKKNIVTIDVYNAPLADVIKQLERQKWPYTTLYDVMRPFDQLHTVTPATPVMEALETMGRDDVNQLPVVSDDHLEGIVTRGNVLQFLRTRAELGR